MLNIINFVEKYLFTYENMLALLIMIMATFIMKSNADIEKLKAQAIGHGFAKYDEYKGNWRWITEEDLLLK